MAQGSKKRSVGRRLWDAMLAAHGSAFTLQFVQRDGEESSYGERVAAWVRAANEALRQVALTREEGDELVRTAHLVEGNNLVGVLMLLEGIRTRRAMQAPAQEGPTDNQVLLAVASLEGHATGRKQCLSLDLAKAICLDATPEQFLRVTAGRLLTFRLQDFRDELTERAQQAAVKVGVDPELPPRERALAILAKLGAKWKAEQRAVAALPLLEAESIPMPESITTAGEEARQREARAAALADDTSS
jgi:hypothetical protein